MLMRKTCAVLLLIPLILVSQSKVEIANQFKDKGLESLYSYTLLQELTVTVGSRLSGSKNYEKAVQWGKKTLQNIGCDSVWLEPVMVPHWVRGEVEEAFTVNGKVKKKLSICALGGSIGTPKKGITGDLIEVRSFEEVAALGIKAKGKIIFYNRPFDATKVSTGEAYGGAVNQRSRGAIEAARVGAAAVLVRSMTNAIDDEPHTGMMNYNDSIPKIPAAAISTVGANYLHDQLQTKKSVTVEIRLSCVTLSDVPSSNVIGEIKGSEVPNEVILIGGHLDSWDKGQGAHDDGSGVVQSIEVLRLIKELNLRPKRTIRTVLFANEENGLKGGRTYASDYNGKKFEHIVAIESDFGGFAPLGFGVSADSIKFEKIKSFSSLLEIVGADRIKRGGGGADIGPLAASGTAMIGLNPDSQKYFDYHHSNHDTIDKVHPRELELGAIAMAILSWAIGEEGLK